MIHFKMKNKHPLFFVFILLSLLMFSEIKAQSDNAPTERNLSFFDNCALDSGGYTLVLKTMNSTSKEELIDYFTMNTSFLKKIKQEMGPFIKTGNATDIHYPSFCMETPGAHCYELHLSRYGNTFLSCKIGFLEADSTGIITDGGGRFKFDPKWIKQLKSELKKTKKHLKNFRTVSDARKYLNDLKKTGKLLHYSRELWQNYDGFFILEYIIPKKEVCAEVDWYIPCLKAKMKSLYPNKKFRVSQISNGKPARFVSVDCEYDVLLNINKLGYKIYQNKWNPYENIHLEYYLNE